MTTFYLAEERDDLSDPSCNMPPVAAGERMRSYHLENHFTKEAADLFERASELVTLMPDPAADEAPWRCHEVARAVGRVLGLNVVDGHCGAVEHSWLMIPGGASHGLAAILDVYAPGVLPQVVLLACDGVLPFRRGYRPGPPRTDVREQVVETLIGSAVAAGVVQ